LVAPLPVRIGVLALQGDVREHVAALARHGIVATTVRRPVELAAIDALLLPGGESTAMIRLAKVSGLLQPLRDRIAAGMPAFGVCAGLVLLSSGDVLDGESRQETVGGLDVTVRRNAFGRQVASFEGPVDVAGVGEVHGVFIRAPWVERVGPGVEVLATVRAGAPGAGRVVAVREGPVLATSFHPELTGDARVHELFVEIVRSCAGSEKKEHA
jgi:5'-phosphate synthase pdxT subunit